MTENFEFWTISGAGIQNSGWDWFREYFSVFSVPFTLNIANIFQKKQFFFSPGKF